MINKIITVGSIFVLCGCAAGTIGDNVGVDAGKLSRAETLEYRSCTDDTDCIYAQNGCCDCANGGESIAVNINDATEFMSLFDCADVACTAIGAVPPCDQGTAKCEAGICEFVRASEDLI